MTVSFTADDAFLCGLCVSAVGKRQSPVQTPEGPTMMSGGAPAGGSGPYPSLPLLLHVVLARRGRPNVRRSYPWKSASLPLSMPLEILDVLPANAGPPLSVAVKPTSFIRAPWMAARAMLWNSGPKLEETGARPQRVTDTLVPFTNRELNMAEPERSWMSRFVASTLPPNAVKMPYSLSRISTSLI